MHRPANGARSRLGAGRVHSVRWRPGADQLGAGSLLRGQRRAGARRRAPHLCRIESGNTLHSSSETTMNRLRRLCTPAVALALALVQAIAVAQGDAPQRQRPPAPGPVRPLQLPVARESRLANGVTLVLVEDHRAPLVTLVAGVAQK